MFSERQLSNSMKMAEELEIARYRKARMEKIEGRRRRLKRTSLEGLKVWHGLTRPLCRFSNTVAHAAAAAGDVYFFRIPWRVLSARHRVHLSL